MQQTPPHAPPQAHAEYAGLGLRFAAVIIDSVIVYLLVSLVWGVALALRNPIDPQDPAAVQELVNELQASMGSFYLVFFAGWFVYYLLLEGVFSATFGKLMLGVRVVMADGHRVTGLAVVIRNLIRIPEALLLYVPAGISYLSGPDCQRLGDRAARTVVVRRRAARVTVTYSGSFAAPPAGSPPAGPPAPPVPQPATPQASWPVPDAAPAGPAPAAPSAAEALERLKTAALVVRGAHATYLKFSERELAAGSGEGTGGYSEGYVSAWFTLADAVTALRQARSALDAAASAGGRTPAELTAEQPDLAHLLAELAPYLTATDDDAVHAAFLTVARAETPAP